MTWKYIGRERPSFADAATAGQESVWDYPRPPLIDEDTRRIVVRYHELMLADTSRALRVLETASPPTFYLPRDDVRMEYFTLGAGRSLCEWKGEASYLDLNAPAGRVSQAGWSYPQPRTDFQALSGYIAFYPGKLECYVDDERVRPQPGGFYGGWLTAEIVGPVKGAPGSGGW